MEKMKKKQKKVIDVKRGENKEKRIVKIGVIGREEIDLEEKIKMRVVMKI